MTLAGKAVSDVIFNLQPTGAGTEARLPVKNGEFKGRVTPGATPITSPRIEEAAAFQAIPEKYPRGQWTGRSMSMRGHADHHAGLSP